MRYYLYREYDSKVRRINEVDSSYRELLRHRLNTLYDLIDSDTNLALCCYNRHLGTILNKCGV